MIERVLNEEMLILGSAEILDHMVYPYFSETEAFNIVDASFLIKVKMYLEQFLLLSTVI